MHKTSRKNKFRCIKKRLSDKISENGKMTAKNEGIRQKENTK